MREHRTLIHQSDFRIDQRAATSIAKSSARYSPRPRSKAVGDACFYCSAGVVEIPSGREPWQEMRKKIQHSW